MKLKFLPSSLLACFGADAKPRAAGRPEAVYYTNSTFTGTTSRMLRSTSSSLKSFVRRISGTPKVQGISPPPQTPTSEPPVTTITTRRSTSPKVPLRSAARILRSSTAATAASTASDSAPISEVLDSMVRLAHAVRTADACRTDWPTASLLAGDGLMQALGSGPTSGGSPHTNRLWPHALVIGALCGHSFSVNEISQRSRTQVGDDAARDFTLTDEDLKHMEPGHVLVEAGAKVARRARDHGRSPLYLAAAMGYSWDMERSPTAPQWPTSPPLSRGTCGSTASSCLNLDVHSGSLEDGSASIVNL